MCVSLHNSTSIKGPDDENSTVSKIVHQEQKQWQNPRNDSDQSSSSYQELPHGPLPNLKVECALDEYFRDSQRKGLPVTWAMVRKKAAIVAATTWMENKQKGTNRPAHMEGCGSRASSIHLIGPGGTSHDWKLPHSRNLPSKSVATLYLSQHRLRCFQIAPARFLSQRPNPLKSTVVMQKFSLRFLPMKSYFR